ncbi:MAG: YafY family protein [Pseudomonadota bacterium]
MAKKLAYERYLWFHSEIKAGRYPNARILAEAFEVSPKTAQLDVDFMRDRMGAPLEYSYKEKGYYYTDDGFELPSLWLKQGEIVSLVLAKRLAASIPDSETKASLNSVLEKLFASLSEKMGIAVEDVAEKISLKNVEYYGIEEDLFKRVVESLLKNASTRIIYYSPHSNKESERDIRPLHLLNYMGNWHLIGYCTLRDAVRTFALSRIKGYEVTQREIACPKDLLPIKDYLRQHFGIFYGGETMEVTLSFSPKVAGFVKEQIWHKSQKIEERRDKGIILTLPVSDLREIKREVLKFGAEVEVLAPDVLREELKGEIERMRGIY